MENEDDVLICITMVPLESVTVNPPSVMMLLTFFAIVSDTVYGVQNCGHTTATGGPGACAGVVPRGAAIPDRWSPCTWRRSASCLI
jgi:hypothetical protein